VITLFGYGAWGRNIARNLDAMGELGGIVEPEPAASSYAYGDYPHVPPASRASGRAVVIATPADTHYALARLALESNLDVFVEKPFTLDVHDARELVELAARRGRILMVGHLTRYDDAAVALLDAVRTGAIGELVHVRAVRRGGRERAEGPLWSLAPHDLSLLLALAGTEPTRVRTGVVSMTLAFPSGLTADIVASFGGRRVRRFVVTGTSGTAVLDDGALTLNGERVALPPYEPLQAELEHFVHCVRTRERPLTDGREALAVVRILSTYTDRTAVVDDSASVGAGTRIWHWSHVSGLVGRDCTIGQNVYVAGVVGDRCKVQNNVSIFDGVVLEDDVFVGPSAVFTNVLRPRAHVRRMDQVSPTLVRQGATIGAGAVIICGVTIGAYAMVGAGAVVTRNVPPYALVVGNPGKVIGWVCECGERADAPGVPCGGCGVEAVS
jgi:UDP-2-acetamido-3-amino-2,3-dideoxy-glucuronate N-acetyltransferase